MIRSYGDTASETAVDGPLLLRAGRPGAQRAGARTSHTGRCAAPDVQLHCDDHRNLGPGRAERGGDEIDVVDTVRCHRHTGRHGQHVWRLDGRGRRPSHHGTPARRKPALSRDEQLRVGLHDIALRRPGEPDEREVQGRAQPHEFTPVRLAGWTSRPEQTTAGATWASALSVSCELLHQPPSQSARTSSSSPGPEASAGS